MRLQVNNMSINECYGPALLGHLTSKPVHSHKPPLGLLPRSRSKNTAGSVEWHWLCEIYVAFTLEDGKEGLLPSSGVKRESFELQIKLTGDCDNHSHMLPYKSGSISWDLDNKSKMAVRYYEMAWLIVTDRPHLFSLIHYWLFYSIRASEQLNQDTSKH